MKDMENMFINLFIVIKMYKDSDSISSSDRYFYLY